MSIALALVKIFARNDSKSWTGLTFPLPSDDNGYNRIVQHFKSGFWVLLFSLLAVQVSLNGPFFKTSFSTTASLDISSSKRLQVTFQEGCVSTPQLLQGIEFPDSTYVLGQYIDLRNLKVLLL